MWVKEDNSGGGGDGVGGGCVLSLARHNNLHLSSAFNVITCHRSDNQTYVDTLPRIVSRPLKMRSKG